MPGFTEVVIGHYTLSLNVIIPAMVVPGILFTAARGVPVHRGVRDGRQA